MAERFLEMLAMNIVGPVRKEKLEGRDHYVAPVAMMEEGVWNGSRGPLLYPGEELSKCCPSWNHKPLVVYHPKNKDGKFVSACEPNVLNTRKVGVVLNTHYDGKQRAEAWFDIERTRAVDARVIKKLESSEPIEGSTGVVVENDGVGGKFGDKEYIGRALNHQPDHYAVLPDQKGAYSVRDGGGVLAVNVAADEPERVTEVLRRGMAEALRPAGIVLAENQLAFDHRTRQLTDLLSEKHGKPGKYWGGYIHDVYPNYCVYSHEDKTYKHDYRVRNDEVSLVGDPQEVKRVVEYRPVGNESRERGGEMAFDRKAHIAGLIGNGWEEIDRPELEKMSDTALQKIKPVTTEKVGNVDGGTTKTTTTEVVANKDKDGGTLTGERSPPKFTLKELVDNLSGEDKAQFDLITRNAKAYQTWEASEKEKAITTILANTQGRQRQFSRDFLAAKPLDELFGLVEMTAPVGNATEHGSGPPPMFVFGAGGGETELAAHANGNGAGKIEPLVPPSSRSKKGAEPVAPGGAAK